MVSKPAIFVKIWTSYNFITRPLIESLSKNETIETKTTKWFTNIPIPELSYS
jgi:hypothetical protein